MFETTRLCTSVGRYGWRRLISLGAKIADNSRYREQHWKCVLSKHCCDPLRTCLENLKSNLREQEASQMDAMMECSHSSNSHFLHTHAKACQEHFRMGSTFCAGGTITRLSTRSIALIPSMGTSGSRLGFEVRSIAIAVTEISHEHAWSPAGSASLPRSLEQHRWAVTLGNVLPHSPAGELQHAQSL